VRKEIVPSEMSGYRLVEITSCEEENRPPVARDLEVETETNDDVEIRLRASDPDGDPLEYFIVTPPRHGRLEGSGEVVTYKPDRDFEGDDEFEYRASDGRAESNKATVEIEVEEDDDDCDEEGKK
jgi:hypothetical protein